MGHADADNTPDEEPIAVTVASASFTGAYESPMQAAQVAPSAGPTSLGAKVNEAVACTVPSRSESGGLPSNLEAEVAQAVQNGLDVLVVDEHMGSSGRVQHLCQHVVQEFAANTLAGDRQHVADWRMYCQISGENAGSGVGQGSYVPVGEVSWPPGRSAWVSFLVLARSRVGSYLRFRLMVGNVCEVACSFWAAKLGRLPIELDPRALYRADHRHCMRMILREFGFGVTQVAPITQYEALNGPYYCDADTVVGVSMALAFTMGCSMGGRRPRTLTAIRLKDVEVFVSEAYLTGHSEKVKVPGVSITFQEEKFEDEQAARQGTDNPEGEDYGVWYVNSVGFWLYRLACMRGLFTECDPLVAAKPGQRLEWRLEAQGWFLFCSCSGRFWIDTVPVSTNILSNWNRKILTAMGHPARGFSAHRSGMVTRACIIGLLEGQGVEIAPGRIDAIVRWGGWQAVTGAATVLRIYARKVIDRHLDTYKLALGRPRSPDYWVAKVREYVNVRAVPLKLFISRRDMHALQLMLMAAWSQAWQEKLLILNRAGQRVLEAALGDCEIMPVHRYREHASAFSQMCKRSAAAFVRDYVVARDSATAQFASIVQGVMGQCQCDLISRVPQAFLLPSQFWRERQYLQWLKHVEFGEVTIMGQKNQDDIFRGQQPCWQDS